MRALSANSSPGTTVNWSHPLSRGLVACWPMNEGGGQILQDIVAKKNVTLSANPPFSPSPSGLAPSFDGATQTGSYVSNWSTAWLNGPFSLCQRVKVGSFSASISGTDFVNANGMTNFWYDSNHLRFGGNGVDLDTTNITFTLNQWYDIVFTMDVGFNKHIYINGVLNNTTTLSSFYPSYLDGMVITGSGGTGSLPTIVATFTGQMNMVRFYIRDLSAQEVRQLYLQPFAGLVRSFRRGLTISGGGLFLPPSLTGLGTGGPLFSDRLNG